MISKIEIVPYDFKWPTLFAEEAKKIKQTLNEACVAVHHVGSTAVPRLCAKPKIDIITVVKERALLVPPWKRLVMNTEENSTFPFTLALEKGLLSQILICMFLRKEILKLSSTFCFAIIFATIQKLLRNMRL